MRENCFIWPNEISTCRLPFVQMFVPFPQAACPILHPLPCVSNWKVNNFLVLQNCRQIIIAVIIKILAKSFYESLFHSTDSIISRKGWITVQGYLLLPVWCTVLRWKWHLLLYFIVESFCLCRSLRVHYSPWPIN